MDYERKMKTTVTMSIDVDLVAELRARRVKISPLVNNFFKSYLDKKEPRKANEKAEVIEELAILKVQLRSLEDKRDKIEKEEDEEEKERRNNWVTPVKAI